MTTEEGIDSITILIEDPEYYNFELNKLFEDNQLKQFYTPEIKEPDLFIYHFENIQSNILLTMFSTIDNEFSTTFLSISA